MKAAFFADRSVRILDIRIWQQCDMRLFLPKEHPISNDQLSSSFPRSRFHSGEHPRIERGTSFSLSLCLSLFLSLFLSFSPPLSILTFYSPIDKGNPKGNRTLDFRDLTNNLHAPAGFDRRPETRPLRKPPPSPFLPPFLVVFTSKPYPLMLLTV